MPSLVYLMSRLHVPAKPCRVLRCDYAFLCSPANCCCMEHMFEFEINLLMTMWILYWFVAQLNFAEGHDGHASMVSAVQDGFSFSWVIAFCSLHSSVCQVFTWGKSKVFVIEGVLSWWVSTSVLVYSCIFVTLISKKHKQNKSKGNNIKEQKLIACWWELNSLAA